MLRNPSPYQLAIFKHLESSPRSLLIKAVAGSGKSTTIEEAAKRLDINLDIGFMAFNNAIVKELQKRLPPRIDASTFNSAGHRALLKEGLKFDENKLANVMEKNQISLGQDWKDVMALYNLAKGYGVVPSGIEAPEGMLQETPALWKRMYDSRETFGKPDEQKRDRIIAKARALLRASVYDQEFFDFSDQLYLPLLMGIKLTQYDVLFVDEAQDLSLVQISMMKRMIKENGRIVAVGDDQQAIYLFRGADSNALENIKNAFNCVVLPLSVCYRCGKEIVYDAQEFSPLIEPFEKAEDGSVLEAREIPMNPAILRSGVAIISRTNAILVRYALSLLNAKIAFKYMGKDPRPELKGYYDAIDRHMSNQKANGAKAIPLILVITEVMNISVNAADDAEKTGILDNFRILLFVAKNFGATTTRDLQNHLNGLMDRVINSKSGVTLSTIHKSKGLEFETVFFVGREKLPLSFIKNQKILEQENNLIYIGITRAKKRLVYVEDV